MTQANCRRTAAVIMVLALVATACRSSTDETGASAETTTAGDASGETSGDFGTLTDVCQPGDASGSPAQGVTDDEIQLGVFTDFGFTQNREFLDAAEAFTSWCNDAGGINGRQLAVEPRDAQLFEYRQRILEACAADFMLVGGGAAFDSTGVQDRIECLLPDFAAQTVAYENQQSGFQIEPFNSNPDVAPYEGYFGWLIEEQYPETADAVGIIAGDIGATRLFAERETATLEHVGASVVYNDLYPAEGVSDWQPYALALKDAGVQGLVFLGDFGNLAALEQALIDVDHELTWVDANTNAYNSQFIELAGPALDQMPNHVAPHIYPVEAADDNPSMQQMVDIFDEYQSGVEITGPMIQAWSAWLLFATAARDCDDDMTRRCVFENGAAHTDWDGGGLTAPTDLSDPDATEVCFVVLTGDPSGWSLADFGPNEGAFRCEEHEMTLQGDFPDAVTLDDVGVSIDDLD